MLDFLFASTTTAHQVSKNKKKYKAISSPRIYTPRYEEPTDGPESKSKRYVIFHEGIIWKRNFKEHCAIIPSSVFFPLSFLPFSISIFRVHIHFHIQKRSGSATLAESLTSLGQSPYRQMSVGEDEGETLSKKIEGEC